MYESFQNRPVKVFKRGEDWELATQGVVVLSSIERILLRLGGPSLRPYLDGMINRHVNDYGISVDDFNFGIDVFRTMIFHHFESIHDHRLRSIDTDGRMPQLRPSSTCSAPQGSLAKGSSSCSKNVSNEALLNATESSTESSLSVFGNIRRHSIAIIHNIPEVPVNFDEGLDKCLRVCQICRVWNRFFNALSNYVQSFDK